MSFKFLDAEQQLVVHNFSPDTGEYVNTETVLIPAFTGLPADSTDIAPPEKSDGYARVFSDSGWANIEDHRGATVYLKSNGEAVSVSTLGALLDTVTFLAPASVYDAWSEETGEWVEDGAARLAAETEAATALKEARLGYAFQQVEIWSDAVEDTEATETDQLMLSAWKKYRVQLNKVDTSQPGSIVWPVEPDTASVIKAAQAASATKSIETVKSEREAGSD